ncbi:MAG TPA: HAMP domain-containing sensor histidine kinase [Blastocatellia bacterium]|nr:HAMP domain-containing sensor histidine kinase [Blastocatellia bacterium]
MKFWRHPPDKAIVFTAILIGLLLLFAAMQYRWVGQVSDAERERLRESLQTGVGRFSREFDREISRAFLIFQLRPDTSGGELKPYAALYRRWLSTSEHPQLIQDVFVATWEGKESISLKRLDAVSGEFESTTWPPELSMLRDGIDNDCREPGAAAAALRSIRDPIADTIPALVVPPSSLLLVQHNQANQRSQPQIDLNKLTEHLGRLSRQLAKPQTREYAILMLNRGYISQELLPSLARQYVVGGDHLDYRVAVVERESGAAVYESEPDAARAVTVNPDATASLLSLRIDEMTNIASEQGHEPGTVGMATKRVAINIYKSAPDGSAARPDRGRWQLLVKHRAGSLDAMVAGLRRRNLAASFGIVVLLALSLVMLVSSTRRAQRLARQQMEFAAGVSHELRTPLAVIRSAGQNLADRIARDPEQVARYGALIESEGRRLTEMVEQVLDLSGIHSGRKAYTLREVEVADLVNSALRSCEQQAAAGQFHIEQALEQPLPPVNADPGALSQAIANLISNAMKYAGVSKTVHLTARHHQTNGSNEVLVCVRDEGIGIDPSELPHIFEPFYRGRVAVDDQIHGNGLGLSLVKQIVEAHGGRTTVDSAPGKGSTFTIHLPALKPRHNGGRSS